jgi:hypothetical protein
MLLIINRMQQTYIICSTWVDSDIMNTQENPTNESRDTAQRGTVLTKWSAINYWPIGTALTVYVAHAFRQSGVTFRKNPSNEKRK